MKPAREPADDYSASIAVHAYEEAQAEADADLADQLARRTAARDILDPEIIAELTQYCGVDSFEALARCMRNISGACMSTDAQYRQISLDALTTALSNLQRDLRAARYEQIKDQCLATVRGE